MESLINITWAMLLLVAVLFYANLCTGGKFPPKVQAIGKLEHEAFLLNSFATIIILCAFRLIIHK